MRLVCREFNDKTLDNFVRDLVIKFHPDLETKLGPSRLPREGSSKIDIFDRLLRTDLFQDRAPYIRRVAFALELDEGELETPPASVGDDETLDIKHNSICRIPAPVEEWEADPRLEKIISAFQKQVGVVHFMRKTEQVREFALSCSGGLGYVQGPDTNALQPPGPPPIFGDPSDAVLDEPVPLQLKYSQSSGMPYSPWVNLFAALLDDPRIFPPPPKYDKSYRLEMLQRRMASCGISSTDFSITLDKIMESEEITFKELVRDKRQKTRLPLARGGGPILSWIVDDLFRLQPDSLTEAQMRYIFQHIAAEQALVQSFVITVLDSGRHFTNLTRLNIARLPSFHVDFLCRHDFWGSLSKLEEVALGIIPDWKALSHDDATSYIVPRAVYPTNAMPKVFNLLGHIGRQRLIKRIHFEWHCGGEFAPGVCQRGRYVLPAPILKDHRKVINSSMDNLLQLPHVTHLSLKNCWFTPHVFYRFVRGMGKMSLESLELETVSLSGPPIFPDMLDNESLGKYRNPLQSESYSDSDCLYYLSWPHIIDMLTPGRTIREDRHQKYCKDSPPLRIRKDLKLRELIFKSCGYVHPRDWRFVSSRRLSPPRLLPTPLDNERKKYVALFARKRMAMAEFMQRQLDRHLADISPGLPPEEASAMEQVFGLRTGWDGVYPKKVSRAAEADGMYAPGHARFSGTIKHPTPVDPNKPCWGNVPDDKLAVKYEFETPIFENDYDDEAGLAALLLEMERTRFLRF